MRDAALDARKAAWAWLFPTLAIRAYLPCIQMINRIHSSVDTSQTLEEKPRPLLALESERNYACITRRASRRRRKRRRRSHDAHACTEWHEPRVHTPDEVQAGGSPQLCEVSHLLEDGLGGGVARHRLSMRELLEQRHIVCDDLELASHAVVQPLALAELLLLLREFE